MRSLVLAGALGLVETNPFGAKRDTIIGAPCTGGECAKTCSTRCCSSVDAIEKPTLDPVKDQVAHRCDQVHTGGKSCGACTDPCIKGDRKPCVGVNRDGVLRFQFNPLIHRMVDKLGWTEERARAVFGETLLFLYNAATSAEPLSPEADVDEVWHNFILFTQDYMEFCTTHFGKYIHHRPKRRGETMVVGRCSCSEKSCADKPCKS